MKSIKNKSVSKKSMNVRSKEMIMYMFQFAFRVLGCIAPTLTGKIIYKLSFRARRFTRPPWEQKLIEQAHSHSTLPWRDGHLAIWSWGQGPIVLLVHGWEGRGTQLGKFIQPLVKKGFCVVAFDGPGHGISTVSRASMPDQAAAVCHIAKHLGSIYSVIGHSMGGAATTYATALGLKASNYTTISTPAGIREILDTLKKMFRLRPASVQVIVERAKKEFNINIQEFSLHTYIQTVKEPAFIIHDKHDREIPFSKAIFLAKHWPNSKLLLTEELGHRRILKDENVIREVVDFVSRSLPAKTNDKVIN